MPIYVYKCNTCGNEFEVFYKTIPKEEKPKCPECGSDNVRKKYIPVEFQLDFTFSETGYDITHREMQRNQDESKFLEDEFKKKNKR